MLVVSVSACMTFSILDAVRAGPPAGDLIRIVLPGADHQTGGYPIGVELPSGARAHGVAAATPVIRDGAWRRPIDLADAYAAQGEADSGGSALVIGRPARIDAGSAGIRVSAESTLSIEGSALAGLLERAGRRDLAEQNSGGTGSAEFIGFDQLRRQGIDVLYDPETDHVLISV